MHDILETRGYFNPSVEQYFMNYIRSTEIRKIQALTGERSFTLVLPKQFAAELGVGRGDFMKCRVDNGRLVVERMIT